MNKFSYLNNSNPEFIEDIYAQYRNDPESVDSSWKYFFDGLELGYTSDAPPFENMPPTNGVSAQATSAKPGIDLSSEAKVADLINAYRERGHLLAHINPLGDRPRSHPLLKLEHFSLGEKDMDRPFTAGKFLGLGTATLRQILDRLHQIYCSSIGVEYTHIKDPEMRGWLVERMESTGNQEKLSPQEKRRIFSRLAESETFEKFLHTRYVAQKRFSIEGAEGVIPTLDRLLEVAGELGANNIVMGMAHRGRLNVLRNFFGKKAEHILTEFEQEYQYDEMHMGEGDVKYHMGYSTDVETSKGHKIHLSLANNPSHLAFVHPVVEGVARSKQRRQGPEHEARRKIVPIMIHGDAAFAGQGVVYETLNLSQVDAYCTGGTVHIIINNQIGFTTSPDDARSTTYCTDVARMLEVPIFHVNGDDPEALSYIAALCMEFRQRFQKDVFIDIVCYRKYGHNEADEPAFTQPLMYKAIRSHLSPYLVYSQRLEAEGLITGDQVKAEVERFTELLVEAQKRTREEKPKPYVSAFESPLWKTYRRPSDEDLFREIDTKFPERRLIEIAKQINHMPNGFNINPKIGRLLEARAKAVEDGKGIDWGNGELLAYASLLDEGYSIRLTGQDVERGTFSHRNAILFDAENGKEHAPLNDLVKGEDQFVLVKNSTLSETGVLGFEYGWSLGDPNALVIWEAQFGDFANGAQVIIDQFITSGESKWQRASGLVMYLPHGYEGQGPEHSSARLERFLQLSGRANITVGNLSTPAQLFHALRRQLKRDFRKPLVLMTPKSLLRHPLVVSSTKDFTEGRFQEVIDDARFENAQKARKVILCSGKIYYDLLMAQQEKNVSDVALVRVEQLYPWPEQQITDILTRYDGVKEFHWVQEEPRNMGAWLFVQAFFGGGYRNMSEKLGNRLLHYVGRGTGAAPAVGSAKLHARDQAGIIAEALK
ncbi:MAG: 2-oxoglutarate dehydrogenase E1 component [Bdellovibrionota bacterium]